MNARHVIPSATAMAGTIEGHKEAPTAIWLGLLMDGIPEALTIGAHIISAPISPSLLAGLFISNSLSALQNVVCSDYADPKFSELPKFVQIMPRRAPL